MQSDVMPLSLIVFSVYAVDIQNFLDALCFNYTRPTCSITACNGTIAQGWQLALFKLITFREKLRENYVVQSY